ncbi:MAG: hypothetical protein ACMUJM_24610 [bacterium]
MKESYLGKSEQKELAKHQGMNRFYLITFIAIIISVILSELTHNYDLEILTLIDVILFSMTTILISASLMLAIKSIIKWKIYTMPLALLFGLLSCFIYFKLFKFTFADIGGGEGGMIFGGIFGVLGSIAVGLMSILVNFLTLFFFNT